MDHLDTDKNLRHLRYLDLNIPYTSHETYKGHTRTCNFERNPKIHHLWHNSSATDLGKQLNTIVDLMINLSERLASADDEMISLIKKVGKKTTSSPDLPITLIEQVNTIHKNQDFLQTQVQTLMERVEKTLHKADKFPSKKDIKNFTEEIKEVVKLPNHVEKSILDLTTRQEKILKEQAEQDALALRKILLSVEKLRLTFLGEDPEQAELSLVI